MRVFQCAALMAVLAVASSQYLPGGGGLVPPRKHMSDSALNKFLSVVRGGGRGHRELLQLTASGSSPAYATIQAAPGALAGPPPFGAGIGRLPGSVTHVPAPPKIGAFYISPPERNAPSYYSGGSALRRPQLLKITELQNARPSLTLLTSETSNRPTGIVQQGPLRVQQAGPGPQGPPQGVQYIQITNAPGAPNGIPPQFLSRPPNAPGAPNGIPPQFLSRPPNAPAGIPPQFLAAQNAPNQLPPQFFSAAPNGIPQQFLSQQGGAQVSQNVVQTGPSQAGESQSLQEIIAKAAQQQHAKVIAKEQKAHPNAQITSSQILVPGAGQQPVFLNQFGQPFLAPAILGGQPQQQNGQPQQIPAQIINTPQGPFMIIQGPPQQLPPHLRQQQRQPQQNSVTGDIPEQLKGQSTIQEQQVPLQFINSGGLHIPQGQGFSVLSGPQGGPGNSPFGASPQQFQGGQFFNFPQGLQQGNIAFAGLRGSQGSLIPGNSVLGQPHFALVGNQDSQGFSSQLLGHGGQEQQQEKGAEKEEQPTRPLEAASQQVSHSVAPIVPLAAGHGHMTAAIMQSQVELNEPIHKL